MPSSVVDDPIAPTILVVRQRIAAHQRALHRIPRLQSAPRLLPEMVSPPGLTPRAVLSTRIRCLPAPPFSLSRNTQQMEIESWFTDCLTMAVTLLNIALWATLFSLW